MTKPASSAPAIRDAVLAACLFGLSTLVTWWFIEAGAGLYASREKMLLSCGIAGAKWAVQIVAALAFAGTVRWAYIRRLGWVCLAGSTVLLPFCFVPVRVALGTTGFFASLAVSVVLMIGLYWWAVRRSGLQPRWFWGWIACLAVAITLQVTVVAE